MKSKLLVAFRWITPASISKFFDFKELIAFILPTTGFYYEIIPKLFTVSRNTVIISSLLIFTTLLLYHLFKRFMDHERAIAEVLETGYFSNFFDKTALYINSKIAEDKDITFRFLDGSLTTVKADRIHILVIIPLSKQQLFATIKKIDSIAKIGTIDNGSWIHARQHPDGTIAIYECPRTLTSLSKYLVNKDKPYLEEQSKKLHKIFDEKFLEHWNQLANDIAVKLEKVNTLNEHLG